MCLAQGPQRSDAGEAGTIRVSKAVCYSDDTPEVIFEKVKFEKNPLSYERLQNYPFVRSSS